MQKNVIIGGLIVWNLILMAALAFIWIGSRGPQTVARQDEPGGESPRSEAEADEQTMQLKAGDRFVGDKALRIADRQVTITTTFEIQDQDGVLVAHGGLAHGYALYVQQTQLLFIVRRNNALTTVDGGYLKPGRHTVTATLARTGDMNLVVDGEAPRKARAAGAIMVDPVDGLEAGGDRGAPVGPYETPNTFGGTIASVTVSSARP